MKGAENMTVSKNPTSLKLSMDVENGTNALGAMQTKSLSLIHISEPTRPY